MESPERVETPPPSSAGTKAGKDVSEMVASEEAVAFMLSIGESTGDQVYTRHPP